VNKRNAFKSLLQGRAESEVMLIKIYIISMISFRPHTANQKAPVDMLMNL
jgi:hypothetical protein